jgi:hypothetical protein
MVPRQKSRSQSPNLTYPGLVRRSHPRRWLYHQCMAFYPMVIEYTGKPLGPRPMMLRIFLWPGGQLVGGFENILNTCGFKISGCCIEFQALFVNQRYSFLPVLHERKDQLGICLLYSILVYCSIPWQLWHKLINFLICRNFQKVA